MVEIRLQRLPQCGEYGPAFAHYNAVILLNEDRETPTTMSRSTIPTASLTKNYGSTVPGAELDLDVQTFFHHFTGVVFISTQSDTYVIRRSLAL